MRARKFLASAANKLSHLSHPTLSLVGTARYRLFHSSSEVRFPCLDNGPREYIPSVSDLRNELKAERERHETELCQLRSLIAGMAQNSNNSIPEPMLQKIKEQIETQRHHKIEDYNSLIENLTDKLNKLKHQIGEAQKTIKEKKVYIKTKQDEAKQIESDLNQLKKIDPNDPKFLDRNQDPPVLQRYTTGR